MGRYSGTVNVALHGSASSLCSITQLKSKLKSNWYEGDFKEILKGLIGKRRYSLPYRDEQFKELAVERLEELAVECLSSLPPEQLETVCFYWLDTSAVVLELLEGIAQERPEIEIAVAAELTFSDDGTEAYCSYFSASGENTIHAYSFDVFDSFCNWWFSVPMSVITYKGKKIEFDLADIPNIDDAPFALDWGEVSCFSNMSKQDLACYVNCWCDIEVDDDKKWHIVLCYSAHDKWSWLEIDPDIDVPFSEVLYYSESVWSDVPDECFLQIINSADKDLNVHVERINNCPHVLDDSGNEYFFPCMLKAKDGETIIDWGFPKEATWIPVTFP